MLTRRFFVVFALELITLAAFVACERNVNSPEPCQSPGIPAITLISPIGDPTQQDWTPRFGVTWTYDGVTVDSFKLVVMADTVNTTHVAATVQTPSWFRTTEVPLGQLDALKGRRVFLRVVAVNGCGSTRSRFHPFLVP